MSDCILKARMSTKVSTGRPPKFEDVIYTDIEEFI